MVVSDSAPRTESAVAPWHLLIFVPLIVGAITGVLVGYMVYVIEDLVLERGVLGLPGLWFAVPLIVVIVVTRMCFVHIARARHPGTSDLFPYYYHRDQLRYPTRQVPGRILAAWSTVALGASQGLEATSAMIGDTVGTLLRRMFRRKLAYLGTPDGRRLILVSGAAAGIATVFSSPLLGAAYGIEMPFKNRIDGRRLIASLLAASASFFTASLVHRARAFLDYIPHDVDATEIAGIIVVGIICGLGARVFVLIEKRIKPFQDGARPWLRSLGAGMGLCALAVTAFVVTGTAVTAGPGYVASSWALPEQGPSPAFILVLVALIMRSASVLICVGAGGGGGLFTSLATNGLLVGVLVADVMGIENATLLALAGACAFLGAGYRLPLATAGLAAETTGAAIPTAFCLVAIAIAMAFMANQSASSAQTDYGGP